MTNKILLTIIVGMMGLSCLLVPGCEPVQLSPAPKNLAEYSQMGRADRQRYSNETVLQFNLARVYDPELAVKERLASLAVVDKLGLEDENALADLATLLRDPKCPTKLGRSVLRFLLKQNYSDLAAYVVPLLGELRDDPKLRDVVVKWMKQNAPPEMLAGLVRTWSAELNPAGPGEQNYRDTVKQITGKPWNSALLEAINTQSFTAQSEAYDILRQRVDANTLSKQIRAMAAASDTVRAIQAFIDSFEYLPPTGSQAKACKLIYKLRTDMLPDAAKLWADWLVSYKFRFDIRDFHLLSRLARDPLRTSLNRTELVLEIGRALRRRKHLRRKFSTRAKASTDNFWLQVDKLSMADLWNIYLLNEMLSRPRVRASLRLMADGDLADTHSAWGGLIFYQNGQAEATLYPPDPQAGANDQAYQPTRRLATDGMDSLCRFTGHFEKIRNAERAWPTATELAQAKAQDFCGLILTRLTKNTFCAHYYNPAGVVVSMGTFRLR